MRYAPCVLRASVLVFCCLSLSYARVSMIGLHVVGNTIQNSDNVGVLIHGADHSGTEYACIQNNGIFDGPNNATLFQGMESWGINAIRVPLNSICWLGINGVNPSYGGSNYQAAIKAFVDEATQQGFAVILELHWNAPGTMPAVEQLPGPDEDHSPTFWYQVASTFKSYSNVLFDLFNEPYPDNNAYDSTAAWECWRNGCQYSGPGNSHIANYNYQIVGMQALVEAVRSTGSKNIIMVGGINYANSVVEWINYAPNDTTGNIVAAWHSYATNHCSTQSCWESDVLPVISQVPLITGEIGENDCAHGYIDELMPWLDSYHTGYLAWTWNAWNCNSGPAVISDYSGTPTGFGVGYQSHLKGLPDHYNPGRA